MRAAVCILIENQLKQNAKLKNKNHDFLLSVSLCMDNCHFKTCKVTSSICGGYRVLKMYKNGAVAHPPGRETRKTRTSHTLGVLFQFGALKILFIHRHYIGLLVVDVTTPTDATYTQKYTLYITKYKK